MKKYIPVMVLVIFLVGCEDASKAIDKAQEVANNAVDVMQEKVNSVDLNDLNLDKLNNMADSGKALMTSIEQAINVDFTDQQALTEVKEKIGNAYSCLVDISSESNVDKLVEQARSHIVSEEVKSLVDSSIEKAKEAQKCVM